MDQENTDTAAKADHDAKAALWAEMDQKDGDTASPATTHPEEKPAAERAAEREEPAASADDAAAVAASKQDAAKADPYEGMSEAAKHEFIGLKSMLQAATTRLRNAEGHIGGLNGQLRAMQEAAKATRGDGDATPSPKQIERAQGDPEAMKRLLTDYPEFGSAVKETLEAQAAEIRRELQSLRPQAPAGVSQQEVAALVNDVRSELSVEVAHPGWKQRVSTPEFHGWLATQPREVQALADSKDPLDAVRLLDLNREAAKSVAAQRTQRLNSAAALPTGRASTGVRGKPVEQMNRQEYWAYLDSMDRSQQR